MIWLLCANDTSIAHVAASTVAAVPACAFPRRIPEALQPFMMGITFIPFRKQFDSKGKLEPRPEVPPVSMGSAAAMSTS